MTGFIIAALFILGTIVGSFLGVVVWRIGTGRGLGGRSMCLSCNRKLSWHELIPMVSYIAQGGKCRHCKSIIPKQDFWIELATGILFAGLAYQAVPQVMQGITITDGVVFIALLIAVSCGVVIAVYDMKHRMIHIPSLMVMIIAGIVASIGVQGFHYFGSWHTILGIVAGGVFVPLPFFIMWAVSRGRWIGLGDIEIMAVAGMFFGVYGGYLATVLGFWIACAIVVPWFIIVSARGKKPNHQIPMGPFLLAGMYLVGIAHIDIVAAVARMVQ